MTYSDDGSKEENLNGADLDMLACGLERYIGTGQPGIASLFVYSVGSQGTNGQRQFGAFMDELKGRLGVRSRSCRVPHRGGNLNLAGLLFLDEKLAEGFDLPNIEPGRGKQSNLPDRHDVVLETAGTEMR